jgi:cytochrome c oxidase assembly protein subunit 15
MSVEALPPQFSADQFNATLMWTEYLNRLLGVTVGFFIFGTVLSAWRHHRREGHIVWPSVAALLLTGYEGWLGGRVVAHELAPWIVTAHLVVAIVIVQLLLYATAYAWYRRPQGASAALPPEEAAPRRTLALTIAATIVLTYVQVALGTQVRGAVDDGLDAGIARAVVLSTVGWWDGAHRVLSLGVVSMTLVSLLVVWSRHTHERLVRRWTHIVVGLAVAQTLLGAGLAYVALQPAPQVMHLSLASLLMGAQLVQWLVVRWEAAPETW